MKIDIELLLQKLEQEEKSLYAAGNYEAARALQSIYFAVKESVEDGF